MTDGCDKTIFVVDDDKAIRESLADLLEDEGYSVVTATNGQDALQKLRANLSLRPCVIFLDLMMPVMNGADFYAAQQSDPQLSSIPVVVISADGHVSVKAKPFGGEYLAKPIRIETVIDTIQRHCA
jgi:CheY-like chemotaxis protein